MAQLCTINSAITWLQCEPVVSYRSRLIDAFVERLLMRQTTLPAFSIHIRPRPDLSTRPLTLCAWRSLAGKGVCRDIGGRKIDHFLYKWTRVIYCAADDRCSKLTGANPYPRVSVLPYQSDETFSHISSSLSVWLTVRLSVSYIRFSRKQAI